MQDGKLPVIVGGTNYYIESLLWQVLVDTPENSLDLLEQIKPSTKTEEINRDCTAEGRSFKDRVSDRIEPPIEKESDSAKLREVTCQREVNDKCSYGAKIQKRVLDCDDQNFRYKYQKLEATNMGLNTFSNRSQLDIQNEEFQAREREVDLVHQSPFSSSTDCQEDLDHSDADAVQAQKSAVPSGSEEACRDKGSEGDIECGSDGVKPVIAGIQNKDFGSNVVAEPQGRVRSGKEQVEESSQRQNNGVNFELVYERHRKRLEETLCDELMERKKLRVQGDVVDLMDEASLEHIPSQHLYEKLQAVDPDMAQQLHPNNKRKIIR
jgi:hypothetical protein